jgi:hypothetical protein
VTEPSALFVLDIDLPCIRCGYNLRGQEQSGRCPECGLKAYWSFRAPQKLSEYPATWVTAMARAVRLLAITYGGLFAFLLLACLDYLPRIRVLPSIGFLMASMLQLIGMWMLSSRSGHWSERAAPINRWLVRITPAGLVVASAASIWLMLDYHPEFEWVFFAGMLIGGLAPTAAFIRLRAVARLIADRGLAEHSAIVGYGFLFTAAAMTAFAVILAHSKSVGRDIMGLIVTGMLATALLLFLLWGAFILVCCVVDFGRAAKVAREEWKASAPPV